jgi:hypothetical protein
MNSRLSGSNSRSGQFGEEENLFLFWKSSPNSLIAPQPIAHRTGSWLGSAITLDFLEKYPLPPPGIEPFIIPPVA